MTLRLNQNPQNIYLDSDLMDHLFKYDRVSIIIYFSHFIEIIIFKFTFFKQYRGIKIVHMLLLLSSILNGLGIYSIYEMDVY